MDGIYPEFPKTLDDVGLSWLTHLSTLYGGWGQCPWIGSLGCGSKIVKKGDWRKCSVFSRITLLGLPGNVFARLLDRRVHLMVIPWTRLDRYQSLGGPVVGASGI